ncbi:MAG TPA: hypothetical protein VHL34_24975 [Rhizomicrobium sp.]|jgi:hypothetical protein|nr:hypothetical protein [Rhizomicrobium sp.]
MTTNFSAALAAYQRLRAAELAIPPAQTFEEEEAQEEGNMAMYAQTSAALLTLLAIPAPDLRGIGEKLSAVADMYDLNAPGMERWLFGRLMAEVLGALGGEWKGLTEKPKGLSERIDDFRARTIAMNAGSRSQAEWDDWSADQSRLLEEVLALPHTSENARIRAKAIMVAHIGDEGLGDLIDACPTLSGNVARQLIYGLAGVEAAA